MAVRSSETCSSLGIGTYRYDSCGVLLNAYCTHLAPPAMDVPHTLRSRRDRSTPELAEHLRGFMGFVMKDKRPMTATRFHVLRTPDGRVLVAPDTGDPAPGAAVPYPVDAVRRKALRTTSCGRWAWPR